MRGRGRQRKKLRKKKVATEVENERKVEDIFLEKGV